MPIHYGKDSKGPFVQWGHQKKYHYKPNDKKSLASAKARAKKQMKAIFASGYVGESVNTFYRVTYEGIGIYEALKNNVSSETWQSLLTSDAFTWLPKPPEYLSEYSSFFTELGMEKFKELVLPICEKYLNRSRIAIQEVQDIQNIVYSDDYQVIVNSIGISKFDQTYKSIINEIKSGEKSD